MPRTGTTSSRGYDAAHQRAVAQLKQQMRANGGPWCARGGEWLQVWQLDLVPTDPLSIDGDHLELPLALGGTLEHLALSCAHHNRQHGARLGNRARRHGGLPGPAPSPSRDLAPQPKTSRSW